ncbi:MAG TPA: MYXO-CTERM sorting domain-containing protein, partial [Anaeromyxobacteraceae bacterium]
VNNACPAPTDMGNVTVEATIDVGAPVVPTPKTATFPGMTVNPWADVETSLDGPAFGTVGQSAVFTHTIVNHGPCPSTNVIATFFPNINISTMLSYTAGSGTGVCAGVDPIADGVCPIGDLAKAQTVTWTDTFKIGSLPDSVIQTTIPYEFDANSYSTANDPLSNPPAPFAPPFNGTKAGIVDPATGNNTADAAGIRIGKEAGGCSSGGPGGLAAVALMAAAVFAARRRRTA